MKTCKKTLTFLIALTLIFGVAPNILTDTPVNAATLKDWYYMESASAIAIVGYSGRADRFF